MESLELFILCNYIEIVKKCPEALEVLRHCRTGNRKETHHYMVTELQKMGLVGPWGRTTKLGLKVLWGIENPQKLKLGLFLRKHEEIFWMLLFLMLIIIGAVIVVTIGKIFCAEAEGWEQIFLLFVVIAPLLGWAGLKLLRL